MEGDLYMLRGPNGYYYVTREGKQGIPGVDGLDGKNTYIAYASDANGSNISLTPSNGLTYIAIMQSDTHYGSEAEIFELFANAVWLQYLGQVTLSQLNEGLSTKLNWENENVKILHSTNTVIDTSSILAEIPADESWPASGDVIVYICNRYCPVRPSKLYLQQYTAPEEGETRGYSINYGTYYDQPTGDIQNYVRSVKPKLPRVAALRFNGSAFECIDAQLLAEVLTSNYYTKAEADHYFASKSNTYTKTQTDNLLAAKAASSHSHSQSEVTGLAASLAAKQNALPSGTPGQVLTKTADGVEWADVPGSGGGSGGSYDAMIDEDVVSPMPDDFDFVDFWDDNQAVRGKSKVFVGTGTEGSVYDAGHLYLCGFLSEPWVYDSGSPSYPTLPSAMPPGEWTSATVRRVSGFTGDNAVMNGDYYEDAPKGYWVKTTGDYAIATTSSGSVFDGTYIVPIGYADVAQGSSNPVDDFLEALGDSGAIYSQVTSSYWLETTVTTFVPSASYQRLFWFQKNVSGTFKLVGVMIDITPQGGADVLSLTSDPTSSTVGELGQHAVNTTSGAVWTCVGISGSTYTWAKCAMLDGNGKVSAEELPNATSSEKGAVSIHATGGLKLTFGNLYIDSATYSLIDGRISKDPVSILGNERRPIVPCNLDYAVRSVIPNVTAIPAATSAYSLLDASATTNSHSWHYTHEPTSAPTYTLPAVSNSTVTHTIDLKVKFSSNVTTYSFVDSSSAAVTPLSTPTIAAGTVVDFLCEWEPLTQAWVVMPLVLVEGGA